MRTTRNDSHYQILIGNLKLVDNNLPRQTLTNVAGMILPKRASILYGTQVGFKVQPILTIFELLLTNFLVISVENCRFENDFHC